MKKLSLLLVVILFAVTGIFAQTPNQFKYQAILRNADGTIMAEENVTVDIAILKGNATGEIVFGETHNVNTTAQGLININIGSANDMSEIDWSIDTYFIEISVNGTVMGTGQLLSVPYALTAKEVENVDYYQIINTPDLSGYLTNYTETDPIFTAWDKDYLDLTNKPVNATTATDGFMSSVDKTKLDGLTNADGSETKVTSGINITVTGSGTTASPYVVGTTPLTIGQSYQGGIIFWLDATGQHGLIAATTDQSTGIQWYNDTYRYTAASGDGLYAGAMNTAIIIATQAADYNTGNFAAKVCADYSVTDGVVTYGDWYLPSTYELSLLYQQKNAVGGFAASGDYWGSSEMNNNYAYTCWFENGSIWDYGKEYVANVRAIRAF